MPKELSDFVGYKFLAYSSNGAFHVISYIAKVRGRKVYGYFSWKLGKYVEEPA